MLPQPAEMNAATDLFNDALNRAKNHQLSIADVIGWAEKLDSLGQKRLSAELYKTWIAHNSGDVLLHAAVAEIAVRREQIVMPQPGRAAKIRLEHDVAAIGEKLAVVAEGRTHQIERAAVHADYQRCFRHVHAQWQ